MTGLARTRVGVRELRSKLATYLRAAAKGACFIVTQDGVAVAELGPVGGTTSGSEQSTVSLDALAAAGLLEPPRTRNGSSNNTTPSPNNTTGDGLIQLPVGVTCTTAMAELRGTHIRRGTHTRRTTPRR